MAQESSDKAETKMMDESLLQLNQGDESLADVEIDGGDAVSAEQALGAQGALDDNQNAALEQSVKLIEASKEEPDAQAVQVDTQSQDIGQ